LEISAWYSVKYYQNRFQIAFLYRDANQFTGLEQCQARDENKLYFHFNTTLNQFLTQKVFDMLGIDTKQQINNPTKN
jgi:hypothetical protein